MNTLGKENVKTSDVDVLVVMNHVLPSIIPAVREWMSAYPTLVIATPLGGGGDIEFDSGSYLFQGAIVEYLRQSNSLSGHTLVIHDDLPLSPFRSPSDLLESKMTALCHTIQPLTGGLFDDWVWKPRVFASVIRPRDEVLGSGVMSVIDTLKSTKLYESRSTEIETLAQSTFHWTGHEGLASRWFLEWLRTFGMNGDPINVGLPLYYGMSDFFSFPNSAKSDLLEFLRATLQCRLFVECAIPTMLSWSGLELRSCHRDLRYEWGDSSEELMSIQSQDHLREFFARNPDLLGIHPIKFSKFHN